VGSNLLYNKVMERDQVMKILQENSVEIHGFGVKSLALFGSVARGEARADSDVDLLVEFDRPTGLFGLVALQKRLEELLGCSVDVGTPDSLKASIRSHVLGECVYVT
jgi:uncharacterized protein